MQFKVPELGEGVHEGELVKWKVKVGDKVIDDQPICEVMTDKATMEIPAPFSGTVTELLANEGSVVKVGQAIISYDGGAGSAKSSAKTETKVEAPKAHTPPPAAAKTPVPQASRPQMMAATTAAPGAVLAAPSTRKLAREMGMDIGSIPGSGPHGRVIREDLSRAQKTGFTGGFSGGATASAGFAAAPSPTPVRAPIQYPNGGEQRVPFKGLRKKIAEKMRLSKDHAAHFTYVEEADATALVDLRERAKEIGAAQGVKVTYLPFVMKAMVSALRQFPILNSSLDEEKGELVYKHFFNIGLSIQTEDGLTAPVVKNVEHKSVLEIARDIQDLVNRARAKKLTLEDFAGGTITLTNAGSIGGLFATPVINFPEVAILGFNKIFKKPVVKTVNGRDEVVIRQWTYFSISLDHRVVDGAVGAEFMKTFIAYIENPSLLLLESF